MKYILVSNFFNHAIDVKPVVDKFCIGSHCITCVGVIILPVTKAIDTTCDDAQVILVIGTSIWIGAVIPKRKVSVIAITHYRSPADLTTSHSCIVFSKLETIHIIGSLVL